MDTAWERRAPKTRARDPPRRVLLRDRQPAAPPGDRAGTDLFLRVSRAGMDGQVTVYRNAIDDFICYAPPGRSPPPSGATPSTRRAAATPCSGGGGGPAPGAGPGWAVEAVGSHLRADREGAGGREPLPATPPAQGRLRVRRDMPCWFAEVGGWIGSRSHRVLYRQLLAPGLEPLPGCETRRINQGSIRCWSSLIAVHFQPSKLQPVEGGDDANRRCAQG